MTRERLFRLAVATEGGLIVFAFVLAGFFKDIVFVASYEKIPRDFLIGLMCALPPLALFVFVCLRPPRVLSSFRKVILKDVRRLFSESTALDLVLVSLMAGAGEELMFRGVLQAKTGIVWTSLIFGLLHFLTPAYFIFATAISFYLGQLYIYFHGVTAPAAAHFAYDLGALIYLRFIYKGDSDRITPQE